MAFYGETLSLKIEIDSAPDFALVRVGPGASIGLLAAHRPGRRQQEGAW